MSRLHTLAPAALSVTLAVVSPAARAEDPAGGYVTREEYEELKAEMLALKKELAGMKKETHAAAGEEKADTEAAARGSAEAACNADTCHWPADWCTDDVETVVLHVSPVVDRTPSVATVNRS